MADDGTAQSHTAWPLSKFRFQVQWDSAVMHFEEVSGLDAESQPIEYRSGNSPQFNVLKMPGLKKFSDVTLKKGVSISGSKLWDWLNQLKTGTVQRKQVTIRLLDEGGVPVMTWTLSNAWPNKVSGTDLKAQGNDVAVEFIVLSHEGLSMAQA